MFKLTLIKLFYFCFLKAAQLLHLPPELQLYSQEAYDLYLLGLQPVDYDKSWSFASTLKIQKSISNLNFQDGDNKFFTANVSVIIILCYANWRIYRIRKM